MKKTAVLLVSIFLFLSAVSAHARDELLILFDGSLSMAENLNGIPKYKIAAEAASEVLSRLPEDYPAGLRVIGVMLETNVLNYITGMICRESYLAVPVHAGSAPEIEETLKTIFPFGITPIVYSLDTALKNDFTKDADLKHVILVTDGIDECGGDICGYIKDTVKNRDDIKIDVIAIGLNSPELSQLKCLSDYSKGRLISASSRTEMKQAFISLITNKISPQKSGFKGVNFLDKRKNPRAVQYKNVLIEFEE